MTSTSERREANGRRIPSECRREDRRVDYDRRTSADRRSRVDRRNGS